VRGLAHLYNESDPIPEQVKKAIEVEGQAFRRTFGEERYREAVGGRREDR